MLLLAFLFTVSFSTAPVNPPATLPEIRSMYIKANDQERTCKDLIALLKPYDETNNPLFLGYKAAANMMMAKHVINPFSKLSWFHKGRKMLEAAIKADHQNVELRCLRFGIQSNIPSFLNYKENINGDKKFILQSYQDVKDPVLKKNIVSYMNKWGNLTPAEKEMLK